MKARGTLFEDVVGPPLGEGSEMQTGSQPKSLWGGEIGLIGVLGVLALVSTMFETTGVEDGVVTAPVVVEVCPRWLSLAGGVSVTV